MIVNFSNKDLIKKIRILFIIITIVFLFTGCPGSEDWGALKVYNEYNDAIVWVIFNNQEQYMWRSARIQPGENSTIYQGRIGWFIFLITEENNVSNKIMFEYAEQEFIFNSEGILMSE